MTVSDADGRETDPGALARFGVRLFEFVLWMVFAIGAIGGVTYAAFRVTEAFALDQTAMMIPIAIAVLLWIPLLMLAMRLSSRIVHAVWPKTLQAPTGRVEFHGDAIVSRQIGKRAEKVPWRDLQEVHIVNQDGWPIGSQFWLLVGANGTGAVVPSDAAGAQDLLSEMQKRLPGFDNRAVVMAMGSTTGSYRVWRVEGVEEGAG